MLRRLLLCTFALVSCAPAERAPATSLRALPLIREALRAPAGIAPTSSGFAFDGGPLGARVSAGALRVAVSTDAWLELVPLDDSVTALRTVDGALVANDARPATDVVWIGGQGHIEEFRVLHDRRAPRTTRYRLTHGPAIASLRVHDGRIDAIDAGGRAVIAGERNVAADARGVTRELAIELRDEVLTIALDDAGMHYPIVVDPGWSAVAPMLGKRSQHTLAALPDGKAIAIGGTTNGSSNLSTTEIYDPVANTWTAGPAMTVARALHTTTAIAGGKFLVAGGGSSTAEVFTPGGSFAATGSMSAARTTAAAVALPSGKVLITGGTGLSTAELYDPTTGTFSAAAAMASTRFGHSAFPAAGGKVVVIGGSYGSGGRYAELYDPATNTWSDISSGATVRTFAFFAPLPGERVLAAGGNEGGSRTTAEIFDAATMKWTPVEALPRGRDSGFTATLASGAVLLLGGLPSNTAADVFDPTAGKWSNAPSLAVGRDLSPHARLNDGRVLVAGGEIADPFGGDPYLSAAEVFAGEANGKTCSRGGDCTSGACVDGVCCDRGCTGQCEACDLPGKVGTCSFVTGAPRGGKAACAGAATCNENSFTPAPQCDGAGKCAAAPIECGGFKCTSEGCRMACTDASHCAANFTCNAGVCIPVASAACEQPGLTASISAGTRTECNAYLCDPGTGRCRDKCSDSTHCATGFVCGNGACEKQPAADAGGDDGGCVYGARGSTGFGLALAIAALIARRRRA